MSLKPTQQIEIDISKASITELLWSIGGLIWSTPGEENPHHCSAQALQKYTPGYNAYMQAGLVPIWRPTHNPQSIQAEKLP